MRWLLRVSLLVVVVALAGAIPFYFYPLQVNDQIVRLHLRRQNVQSEYVAVDGYTIHYFEAVPPARLRVLGDGYPIVLIHGLGSRGEDWSGMIPTLANAGFHVYVPDLLGYGRSSQPDVDYSITTEEKTVVDFMHAVHIDHADVGGWSMGGWIALKLTLDHPDLVGRLAVFDSAGLYFPPTFDASLFTPTDSNGVARLTAMLSPHPRPLPGFASQAAVRRLQASAWVIHRSVQSMEEGRDLLDFRLGQIERPTLIVWGSEDKLIPPGVGMAMHRKIAGSSLLIVEGCGHLAPSECTTPMLAATLKFLEAQPPLPGGEQTVSGAAK
jgi:pimeloyl-ACP methyl ester carboxylesterase